MSFEEFFSDYENENNCSPEKYECYEAGAQSRQQEVEQLQTEIDELQKRIEKVMEILEYNEYENTISQALDVLKGETK